MGAAWLAAAWWARGLVGARTNCGLDTGMRADARADERASALGALGALGALYSYRER